MISNQLKLNDDKTECLLIVSNRTSLPNPHLTSIHIGNTDILFSLQAKHLGITLTNKLSMEKHVTNICRSAYIEIQRISNIHHYLTIDATEPLLCAFVLSKLDCCNFLLSGSPKHLDKLQKIQNSAARLVFKARKHEHIKPLLQKLHWLPVISRIQYKVATLYYNSFTESYPVYLSEFLTVYHPSKQLRSISDTRTFCIPFTKTKTFGQQAFSFTGLTQWNSLLYDVHHSVSTSSFKQALKTHLPKSAYVINTPKHTCVCVCVCVCACVCVCVCNIPLYIFVFAVYLLVSYMCAKIIVWSCLFTENFGLFTEIAVCKFLRGGWSYGPKPLFFNYFLILSIVRVYRYIFV